MTTVIDKYEWHVRRMIEVQKEPDADVLVLLELVEKLRVNTQYFSNRDFQSDVDEWFNILTQYYNHRDHQLRTALFYGSLYLFREMKRKEYLHDILIDSSCARLPD
ncbi:hypothetical protein OVA10_23840 [Lelliottia sp. SL45]|uniref:hypothetical protein n=1 Tax=Lelliottia sp. SL45 TaxID=2994665 RepID=UPI002276C1F8|nr:hypothetical protein [Lelliottia sp. SL45]MCY1701022.1 hypothetical protein [Lelliottia sp. SL45]MCY1701036.1 hypothetical protein [Lelliottia sp. SL45]